MSVSNKFSAHQFIDVLFGQFGVEAPIELRQGGLFCEAGCLEACFSKAASINKGCNCLREVL
jgi:hypothetical protein